jgi:hypothetical protein
MSVVSDTPVLHRHTRRVFVFEVEQKLKGVATHLKLGNNTHALADKLGIKRSTMADAIRDKGCTAGLHKKLEDGLKAERYRFSRDWPEWIDPKARHDTPWAQRKDTAEKFIARFAEENAGRDEPTPAQESAFAPPGSAPREDARALERFIEELPVRDIKTIRVFATTGTATVRSLPG